MRGTLSASSRLWEIPVSVGGGLFVSLGVVVEASFDDFYRRTRDACFRALVVVIRQSDEAGDLLAESYTRAWERWDHVGSHPAPSAWVMRTALNLHRDRWRRRQLSARLGWLRQEVAPPELPVDQGLLNALHSLPRRQREVVALRVLLDYDTAQTSQVLGISPGTVTTHLHRGLTTLRGAIVSREDLE